jgi:hypothetical protein
VAAKSGSRFGALPPTVAQWLVGGWMGGGGNIVFITPMGHNKNEVPYEHGAPLGHSQVLSTFSAHLWATPLGHSQVLSTPLGHTSGPQAGSQHTSGPQAGSQHTSGPHPGSQHTSRPHLWHMGPHFYRGPVWLVGGMKTIPPPPYREAPVIVVRTAELNRAVSKGQLF